MRSSDSTSRRRDLSDHCDVRSLNEFTNTTRQTSLGLTAFTRANILAAGPNYADVPTSRV